MIATGGLLRISARRQDSLRSKNRAQNKRKRKAKKKRKNDVVVVKGKLKLCSISGLIAAIGILVLLVGIAMAVMGYWPKHSPVFQDVQLPKNLPSNKNMHDKLLSKSNNQTSKRLDVYHIDKDLPNNSHSNSTSTNPSVSLFAEFLAAYLYSDKLKVFGPLIMGIGIFLFICANAVLHENRDKKTKIINLRDIYSTVIDIHSLRTKDCTPLNGFVNYVQSRSAERKSSGSYSTAMLAKTSWPSTVSGTVKQQDQGGSIQAMRRQSIASRRSLSRERQSFTETVYSIYRDQTRTTERAPVPKKWETRSIVTSSINAFTLPVIKLNNCVLEENNRQSVSTDKETQEAKNKTAPCDSEEAKMDCTNSDSTETKAETSKTSAFPSEDPSASFKSTVNLQGAQRTSPQGSQVQLLPPSPSRREMGSNLSLSALSDYSKSIDLGDCPSTASEQQGERCRRLSCPRLERSNSKGYIKLGELGGESFESSDLAASSSEVTKEALGNEQESSIVPDLQDSADKPHRGITRQYTNREKLVMISKSDSNLSLDNEELESTGI
ncbi:transmembrane protein 200A [Amia ocellicauda]|uniref:transmembrane protein 200A n=1 Tax=Amia ocellicauda TaxID=2972642 RepID=UPI003463D4B1